MSTSMLSAKKCLVCENKNVLHKNAFVSYADEYFTACFKN